MIVRIFTYHYCVIFMQVHAAEFILVSGYYYVNMVLEQLFHYSFWCTAV